MKAIVLAGGRGERLSPLTASRPKPLMPLLARPILDYVLSYLAHYGVSEAFVTTHYLADMIRERYGEKAFGMALFYPEETRPMGTCGVLSKLKKELAGERAFVVISGDALCDFDLARALAFHEKKEADATLILSSVRTPLEFGVVLSDGVQKILSFAEKPDWSETVSDLVNTGVYILSPRVLDEIPEDEPFDFSRDLFPALLEKEYRMYGYKDEGYWCDIGRISSWMRCNRDLMAGKVKTYVPFSGAVHETPDGAGRYFVSDTARVSPEAKLGADSVIAPEVTIEKGAGVSGSVILDGARVGENAVVRDAVLDEGVTIGADSLVLPGAVLGKFSRTEDGAICSSERSYPPGTRVFATCPEEKTLLFTEEGVCAPGRLGLNRDEAEKLGAALARFGDEIGILYDESLNSAYFASCLAAGVLRGGANARFFGMGFDLLAPFTARHYRIALAFICRSSDRCRVFLYTADGAPFSRRDTLRLERYVLENKDGKTRGGFFFSPSPVASLRRTLEEKAGDGRKRTVRFAGTFAPLLSQIAASRGFEVRPFEENAGVGLTVFSDEIKCSLSRAVLAGTNKCKLYVLERLFEAGERVFFVPPHFSPLICDRFRKRGVQIFEGYVNTHQCEKFYFLRDHLFLAAALLNDFSERSDEEILAAMNALPEIFVSELRYYPEESKKAHILNLASRLPEKEKKARLLPGYYAIKIISEAMNFEAALDNAFEFRGKLHEIEKNDGGSE